MENPSEMDVYSWENHLFLWAIYTMAMLNNQRVTLCFKSYEIVILHPKQLRGHRSAPASPAGPAGPAGSSRFKLCFKQQPVVQPALVVIMRFQTGSPWKMGGFPVSHENSGLTWFWYETLIKIVTYLQFGDFVSQWIDVGELSMWNVSFATKC